MIFFDIETVSIFDKNVRKLNEDIYKIPKEKYEDKLNFMPEYNRIFCISVWYVKDWEIVTKTIQNIDEREMIAEFFEIIEWRKLCWFNIKGFDIPFVVKRAIFHKVKIPNNLKFFGKKPWELEHIIDLAEIYKMNNFWAIWNLDLICNFLGFISPKDEWINGSLVQQYFDEGREEEICKYCERDVVATIQVYQYFKDYNLI